MAETEEKQETQEKDILIVDDDADIREAIETKFDVVVLSVNTMNYRGKRRVRGRYSGYRPAWKKAVVTLRQGDSIDLLG